MSDSSKSEKSKRRVVMVSSSGDDEMMKSSPDTRTVEDGQLVLSLDPSETLSDHSDGNVEMESESLDIKPPQSHAHLTTHRDRHKKHKKEKDIRRKDRDRIVHHNTKKSRDEKQERYVKEVRKESSYKQGNSKHNTDFHQSLSKSQDQMDLREKLLAKGFKNRAESRSADQECINKEMGHNKEISDKTSSEKEAIDDDSAENISDKNVLTSSKSMKMQLSSLDEKREKEHREAKEQEALMKIREEIKETKRRSMIERELLNEARSSTKDHRIDSQSVDMAEKRLSQPDRDDMKDRDGTVTSKQTDSSRHGNTLYARSDKYSATSKKHFRDIDKYSKTASSYRTWTQTRDRSPYREKRKRVESLKERERLERLERERQREKRIREERERIEREHRHIEDKRYESELHGRMKKREEDLKYKQGYTKPASPLYQKDHKVKSPEPVEEPMEDDEEEKTDESNEEKSEEDEASELDEESAASVEEDGEGSAPSAASDGSSSGSEHEDEVNDADDVKDEVVLDYSENSKSKFDESQWPENVNTDEGVKDTDDKYIEDSPPVSPFEMMDDLPVYYPAIQGCRNVEEFHCLNRIEEGTYGVVYRARDKKTDEIVALKRLKMEKEKEGFPITSLREINTLLKAQHPNIVTVREIVVGSNMDKIYIVMDYVEHDMKALMESMKEPFLIGEVKTLLKQLLRAVAHLHDNWILHRDIKTSNLLFSHKGILKVGDFGLAREYGSPLKPYTPVVVTLWYRAPELLLGVKQYSTAIDMWSVGCVFAEFLTMKALWPGKSEIDELNRIFKDLGTPTERIWPGVNELPGMKKCSFAEYSYNTLRHKFGSQLSDSGFELMNKFLTYNPLKRISAEKALTDKYFEEAPLPIDPSMFPTWPAKSEINRKHAGHSPKPPSGGKAFAKLMDDDDELNLISAGGFHMDSATKGASAGGLGFSLKF